MESPQFLGGEDREECHSSESGWTMYIGSPEEEDGDDDDDQENDSNTTTNNNNSIHAPPPPPRRRGHQDFDLDADDSNSDGSMASDASSGPSNMQYHRDPPCWPEIHKINDNNNNKNKKKKKGKEDEKKEKLYYQVNAKGSDDHKFLFHGGSSKLRKSSNNRK